MASNIVPPFKVADIGGRKYILSANSRALVCCLWHSDWDGSAFAQELCTVMNENHKRLCHAANGEGVASDGTRPATAEEAESGKAQWCAACKTDCKWRGTDSLVVCGKFADKANGEEVRDGE